MTRRHRLAASAAVLLAWTATFIDAPPVSGATAPTLVWSRSGLPPFQESSPLALDVDGDGRLDVAVGGRDGQLYVFRPDGAFLPHWPQPAGHPIDSSPSGADTDGDGEQELFVGTGTADRPAGHLVSFDANGALRFRLTLPDPPHFEAPSVFATPALGDVGGTAAIDVTASSLGLRSIWSFDQGGGRLAGFPFYNDDTVFSSAALVDIDGDRRRDIVVGADSTEGPPVDHRGGMVRAIRGDGRQLWEFRIDDIVRSSPSVGDIDGDGEPEIVFGAGDFWGGDDSVKVFALDRQGRPKPGWPVTTDGVTNASPTLADVDGDGRLDVVIGTFTSTHGKGNGGSVYALRGNGTSLPGFPVATGAGAILGSISTVDLDGDGGQDLVVPTGAGIWVHSGSTGRRLFALAEGRTSFQNQPLVADLDGNGRLDLVAAGFLGGAGTIYRWELGPEATLGARGWHQFRRDTRRTGSVVEAIPPSKALVAGRVEGPDRYATAAAAARAAFPAGAPTIVVATGEDFADALAGGPLSATLGGPVLLTAKDSLPAATAAAIDALRPARALVLGGPGAVSDAVLAAVQSKVLLTARVQGASRFGTAASASLNGWALGSPTAFVATGYAYADGLSGGALAAARKAPLLLTDPRSVPAETLAELRRLSPSAIVVVGGPGVVAETVVDQLKQVTANVTRLAGDDRYATAALAAAAGRPSADQAWLATGEGFADALGGGAAAAALGKPLLLTRRGCVPDVIRLELDRLGVRSLRLLGGDGALRSSIASLTRCD